MDMAPRYPRRSRIARALLRLVMTAAHRSRVVFWYFRRPRTFGVRAIALNAEGAVVLVRHSYVRGWHLPGGGINRGEDAQTAVLRELREEIGMTAHAEVRQIAAFTNHPDFRRDTVTLFLVSGVDYAPRLSLEIEAVAAFPPRALPDDVAGSTRRRIAEWLDGVAPEAQW